MRQSCHGRNSKFLSSAELFVVRLRNVFYVYYLNYQDLLYELSPIPHSAMNGIPPSLAYNRKYWQTVFGESFAARRRGKIDDKRLECK